MESDNILGHKRESTLVKWLTDDLVVTSGLDNTLKVFSFANKQLVAFGELSKSTKMRSSSSARKRFKISPSDSSTRSST